MSEIVAMGAVRHIDAARFLIYTEQLKKKSCRPVLASRLEPLRFTAIEYSHNGNEHVMGVW